MGISNSLRETKEDLKAVWRGERRTAPAGVRGRVYAPKAGSVAQEGAFNSRAMGAKAKLVATAKVYRAASGEVEHYKLIDGQAVRYYPDEGAVGWLKGLRERIKALLA